MSIKPEPTLNTTKVLAGALSSGGVLRLAGRDAIAFAQSQFANDVALLADGQWQWNLWLSAKGRVIALFALLRAGPEELIAWLPDFPAAELAERLTRFRFRSKVVIEVLEQLHACGVFATPDDVARNLEQPSIPRHSGENRAFDSRMAGHPASMHLSELKELDSGFRQNDANFSSGNHAEISRDSEGRITRITLDMSGDSPRTLLLQVEAGASSDADARWRYDDIAHGLPRLTGAQVEAFTPQMLGLERLAAFSVKKGCYPGQEIVARTHFLGQVKRTAVRLALSSGAEPGLRLASPNGAQAELLCIAHEGERIEALAVAPVDTGSDSFHSEDGLIQATPLPLLEGLARP